MKCHNFKDNETSFLPNSRLRALCKNDLFFDRITKVNNREDEIETTFVLKHNVDESLESSAEVNKAYIR